MDESGLLEAVDDPEAQHIDVGIAEISGLNVAVSLPLGSQTEISREVVPRADPECQVGVAVIIRRGSSACERYAHVCVSAIQAEFSKKRESFGHWQRTYSNQLPGCSFYAHARRRNGNAADYERGDVGRGLPRLL
jgi:hypothetical protein